MTEYYRTHVDKKIDYLTETQLDLREALINKGAPIKESDPFRKWISRVNNMPDGSLASVYQSYLEDIANAMVDRGLIIDTSDFSKLAEEILTMTKQNLEFKFSEDISSLSDISIPIPPSIEVELNITDKLLAKTEVPNKYSFGDVLGDTIFNVTLKKPPAIEIVNRIIEKGVTNEFVTPEE